MLFAVYFLNENWKTSPNNKENKEIKENKENNKETHINTNQHTRTPAHHAKKPQKMDSSPFIERPSPTHELQTLKFQLRDVQSQLSLAKIEHETKIDQLQTQLLKQQKENDEISGDQVYLYNQNKDLQSKLLHVTENCEGERQRYETTLNELKTQLMATRQENDELKALQRTKLSTTEHEETNHKLQIQNLELTNEKLNQCLTEKDKDIFNLRHDLNNKIGELESLQKKIRDAPSAKDIESVNLIKNQLSEQVQYIKDLESKNLNQAEQIKRLSLNKLNIEVLKEENRDLKLKLTKVEDLKEQINDLTLENLNLKQDLANWSVYLGPEDKVEQILQDYKKFKDESLILTNNIHKLETELKIQRQKHNDLFLSNESLTNKYNDLQHSYENLHKINFELEQQKSLLFEESNILRSQLHALDQELSLNENDKDKYIHSLESLLSEYKAKESKPLEIPGQKRKRTDEEDTTKNFQSSILKLEEENYKLSTQVSKLSNDNALLLKKYESLREIKEQKIRILQLRNNPFHADQIVKRAELEILRRQVEDLQSKADLKDTVPRSLYDRGQFELEQSEVRIQNLNKRLTRLREIFQSKSLEFTDSVTSLLGYKIEFLPSKIKLIPTTNKNPENCLLIDPLNMTFKVSRQTDDDKVFFDVIDSLMGYWLREKGQVSCFLAAVTLELYERSQSK